jgi:hypothetical protein
MHGVIRVDRSPYCPITVTSTWGFLPHNDHLGLFERFCGHLCGWLVDDNSDELLKSSGLSKSVTIKGEPMAAHETMPQFAELPTINQKLKRVIHVSLSSDSDGDGEETMETKEPDAGGHDDHGTI